LVRSPVVMWLKLSAIALAALGILAWMLLPVHEVEVTLDVPNGMSTQTVEHVFSGIEIASYVLTAMFVLAVVAAAVWLGRRVIKHHRIES